MQHPKTSPGCADLAYCGLRNSERILSRLSWNVTGAEVGELIRRVLHNRKHPEQAFRACLGILNLGKKYGEARLREACEQANAHGICSYKRLQTMMELIVQREQQPELEWAGVGVHENLRGSAYYN